MLSNKQELSKVLLATSKAKAEIKFELDELRANYTPKLLKNIRSLESDLYSIESVHAILETKISKCIENMLELKGIHFIEFSADWDIFTLKTFDRELPESELSKIAIFLGCEYYSSDWDIGENIAIFTNNEEEV